MICTNINYGIYTMPGGYTRVKINQYTWQSRVDIIKGTVTWDDVYDDVKVPAIQMELLDAIVVEMQDNGLMVLNNNFGKASVQLAKDTDIAERMSIWYHLTDKTGAVSLSTMQAPWDDVNDRLVLAAAILSMIDPSQVMATVEKVDSAIVPKLLALIDRKNDTQPIPLDTVG